jgi:predicted ATPase
MQVYEDPRPNVTAEERRDVAAVTVDGMNVGLLSDGTLRVLEILVELLGPPGSMLLVEEPETAVHPGLLARVLALFDSYAIDRQIVLSTHSPMVVSWCAPNDLRLVTRMKELTLTSRLTAE